MLGPVELVDEIDSTNRELLRRARAGAPAGVVLVADHQTAGRGRLDRRWEAPKGTSLLVSVLLRPAIEPGRAHLLTFAAGLAAVDACRAVAGVETRLKWPNDLVVDDRKLAGLLAEAVLDGDRLAAVVIGMGLNLAWQEEDLPDGAISLRQLGAAQVTRETVLDGWLVSLERRIGDTTAVLDDYRRACATLGRRVRVHRGAEVVEGTAEDVTDAGHLVVDGLAHAVGDVVHLRNA